MNNIKKYNIMRIKGDTAIEEKDDVVVEYPFTIYLNNKEFVTFLCSPKSLKYLAIGFLHSEGIIETKDNINDIKIDEDKGIAYVYTNKESILAEKLNGKRTITTGCGKGTIFYNVIDSFKTKKIDKKISINKENIFSLIKSFNKKSEIFLKTGGVHSCGLCSEDDILIFEEDIGRHNALDKIIGKTVIENIRLDNKMVLTSGRVSSEILIKVAKRGIPVLISRSAPTSLAIEMARELNILLIGFARGKKLNIYSDFPSLTF
ncbi:formate dehydrogenase accessory sulfurtransferase FdhD [Dethiothermospora halolimnae]|uniref:formate dehydrogenase accessory sulfurtransferase FdhD n=1 Tax=Dethiothermospora halolimnae TaxID=3114390 RepID=UPI003CCC2A2C